MANKFVLPPTVVWVDFVRRDKRQPKSSSLHYSSDKPANNHSNRDISCEHILKAKSPTKILVATKTSAEPQENLKFNELKKFENSSTASLLNSNACHESSFSASKDLKYPVSSDKTDTKSFGSINMTNKPILPSHSQNSLLAFTQSLINIKNILKCKYTQKRTSSSFPAHSKRLLSKISRRKALHFSAFCITAFAFARTIYAKVFLREEIVAFKTLFISWQYDCPRKIDFTKIIHPKFIEPKPPWLFSLITKRHNVNMRGELSGFLLQSCKVGGRSHF